MTWLRNLLGGRSSMAALPVDALAPDFTLPTMSGSQFSLSEALTRGPVLAVFFKISCPVCQYALPFIERLYSSYGSRNVTIVGISQNDPKSTQTFMREYDITFPVVLDQRDDYPVSNAYGLTNVPTMFWIASDRNIEISCVGWSRAEVEEINRKASANTGEAVARIFHPDEKVADFRAG
jgi:peroxiredoxin